MVDFCTPSHIFNAYVGVLIFKSPFEGLKSKNYKTVFYHLYTSYIVYEFTAHFYFVTYYNQLWV